MESTSAAKSFQPMRSPPLLILMGSWSLFCLASAFHYAQLDEPLMPVAGFVLAAIFVPFAAKIISDFRSRWWPPLSRSLDEHTARVDALPLAWLWLWISLAAGAGLYFELVLIRFHASCFQLFALYKNVSLLSCFMGLGIGYMLGSYKRLWTPLMLPAFAVQVVFLHLLRFTNIGEQLHNPVVEQLALGLPRFKLTEMSYTVSADSFLILIFSFNAICFVPLGQLASRVMSRCTKLNAYSWNLLGSLGGILLFDAVSFLWMPPVIWFAVGIIGMLAFLRSNWILTVISSAAILAVLPINLNADTYDLYSPYQILTVNLKPKYPEILVNHTYFQRILDLRPAALTDDSQRISAEHYNMPYLFRPHPANVLIVGSGTGNDVAAALRNGAEHIDAVEIDPAILKLGRQYHPEQPYASDRVTAHVQDARAFIRYTDQKFDLIVYGLLDSHTELSSLSSVRLDSYVYTVDAFRESRSRLKEGGVICLSFAHLTNDLWVKLSKMLEEAFDGRKPVTYLTAYDGAVMFIIGNQTPQPVGPIPPDISPIDISTIESTGAVDVSTDDWPFFYMITRQYPLTYLVIIGAMFAIAALFVRPAMREVGGGMDAPCFMLGAGFMLLETKAITELALFYGSTWVVIGVVISAILLMAFVANLLVMRLPKIPQMLSYILLLASLALSYYMTFVTEGRNEMEGRIIATAILTLPLFFSGIVFSAQMNRARSVATALGSNLLGAMMGGCLEYNSMALGYRSLYLLAIAIYAIAMLLSMGVGLRQKTGGASDSPKVEIVA